MTDATLTDVLLGVSAAAAGAVNAVAGGGTLLTFPPLERVMGAAAANATSTVALLPGSVAGAVGYRDELRAGRDLVVLLLPPSLVGGLLGAALVVWQPQAFARLVPWLILTAVALFAVQAPVSRSMRRHKPDHAPGRAGRAGLVAFQFLVALYGGYFGAGIGILMLTSLGFMGVSDIHRANAIKTFLAASINLASVGVFVWGGLVSWPAAGLMAACCVVGGYAGARLARRLRPAVVRGVVIAIGAGLAAYYFYKQATVESPPVATGGLRPVTAPDFSHTRSGRTPAHRSASGWPAWACRGCPA